MKQCLILYAVTSLDHWMFLSAYYECLFACLLLIQQSRPGLKLLAFLLTDLAKNLKNS